MPRPRSRYSEKKLPPSAHRLSRKKGWVRRRRLLRKMKEQELMAAITNNTNSESIESVNSFVLPEAMDSKEIDTLEMYLDTKPNKDTLETHLNTKPNKDTYENTRISEGSINDTFATNNKSLSDRIQEHIPEGDCIINVSFFMKELHRVFDGHAPGFECIFKDWILVNTRRRGLLTQFFFKCQTCNHEANFWSHPTDKKVFLINMAITASNCSKNGINAELKKQFAAVNLPCLNEKIDIKQEIY